MVLKCYWRQKQSSNSYWSYWSTDKPFRWILYKTKIWIEESFYIICKWCKRLDNLTGFFNVIHNLKLLMMDKLPFINDNKNFNVVNTLFDDIIAKTAFSTEMIRIHNSILANKLDNDDMDINNNKLNTNNLTWSTRESRKRKCNNKESDISNIQESSIIKSSSKRFKKTIKTKKSINIFNKKKTITKNKHNDKNTKTNEDITHEKENDDDINNLYVDLISRESFIII